MKSLCKITLVAMMAVPAIALAGDDTGCKNVNFSQEVLTAFPNATKTCRDLKVKNDTVYAHFVAEVVDANKDEVTVDFLNSSDKGVVRVKFAPSEDATTMINDQKVKYSNLKKGTRLNLYIPQSQWGIYAVPGGTSMSIISREDI
jgi:hypothetical protein